jgi:hypothetical protein
MKHFYISALMLLFCISGFSQQKEYLDTEKQRIEKAQHIENEIESYIYQNLKKYVLTPEKIEQVKKALEDDHKGHGHSIEQEDIDAALLNFKKRELRELFLKNNPQKKSLLYATETTAAMLLECVNPGFEDGLAGYTFTNRQQQFDIVDCNVDTSTGFAPFTPSTTLNQFTDEGATLVDAGFDPTLQLQNVFVDRVHSGDRAIKLNRSTGNSHVSTMSRNVVLDDTWIDFSFSLIVQNPHPNEPNRQPFFTARLYGPNNQIVSTNEICIKADLENDIFTVVDVPNTANDLLYTDWVCARLNIPEEFVGQTLRLEFVMTDCGYTAHYGTVYIDDICDATCTEPAFGLLELNSPDQNCPSAPFEICGTIFPPEGGTLNTIVLNILQDGVFYDDIAVPTTLTANAFCFTVDPAIFGSNPVGNFEFQAEADFDMPNSFVLTLQSGDDGPEVNFSNSPLVLNSYVINGELYWSDVSDSYEIEFLGDENCCPNDDHTNPRHNYFTTTVTENHFNLYYAAYLLDFECFRWRIKSNCGGWSEWCCLTTSFGYDFPPEADWGNPYEPECYDDTINLCEEYLYVTTPVVSPDTSFEQRQIGITAVNTIQSGARAIYQAGHYVSLEPGFNAVTGSVFLAQIESCTPQTIVENSGRPAYIPEIYQEEISLVKDLSTAESEFSVFPNPTTGLITVRSKTDVGIFSVTDINGKELLSVKGNGSNEQIIDLTRLASGVYFVNADGVLVQKIIKN